MTLVKTKWIGFVDDDDTLNVEYVSRLAAEGKNCDFFIFQMQYSNGGVLPGHTNPHGLAPCYVGISFAIKTRFREKHGLLFINSGGEDWVFIAAALHKGAKTKISEYIGYSVRHMKYVYSLPYWIVNGNKVYPT